MQRRDAHPVERVKCRSIVSPALPPKPDLPDVWPGVGGHGMITGILLRVRRNCGDTLSLSLFAD